MTSKMTLPSASALLMTGVGCLMVLSLIMVASASIPFALSHGMSELHFFYRQLTYMLIGLVAATIVYKGFSLRLYFTLHAQIIMLLITGILLVITLFSSPINGARRWIEFGSFNFQTAELAKLVMILYVSNFVVRHSHDVRAGWDGFFRIFSIVAIMTVLILLQPDFGSLVIIIGSILTIFWIAGAPANQFLTLGASALGLSAVAIWDKEYRLTRVMSFWNPFDDMQNTDYQLARSLIAFGRGEFSGVGYGESVQKLAHLPEAHTDFLLAITGEELGFVGVIAILLLEALVIFSVMRISYMALKNHHLRLSYTAFGFGVIFIGQTLINAGMNLGVMPTKGLTMPFFSYGGSSMVISLIMIGLLLRIHKDSPTIALEKRRLY
ncbi:putative lipid II flippase FtsW [Psychrobacter sp. I-STPA10]|uniref:putative lipid II flippase FtsW n=1 Tax=Psychrobacter sp. I-STPA10 TaxID=2585769 RepID=UPI001E479BBD|nr:putative lipid II flippase FtsW [Psychrobacter sp. I-STPA10]